MLLQHHKPWSGYSPGSTVLQQSRCGMCRGEPRLRCLSALLRGRFGSRPWPRRELAPDNPQGRGLALLFP